MNVISDVSSPVFLAFHLDRKMSANVEHKEKDNSLLNSSSVEPLHEQNHHPSLTKSIDQHTIGPSMHQRVQRPLSTYTSLGSPIHRATTVLLNAPRKMSIGNDSPSTPMVNTMQHRPRSNSHSAVMNRIPTFLLPLQQSIYDDVSYMPPIVEGMMMDSEQNLVTPQTYTTMLSSTDLSNDQKEAIEAVYASEKKRAVDLEKEETNMTADELRQVLKQERARTAKLQADVHQAILKYNNLLSSSHHQQHSHRLIVGESLDDTEQESQGLLTRKQKRKLETVENSTNP